MVFIMYGLDNLPKCIISYQTQTILFSQAKYCVESSDAIIDILSNILYFIIYHE
jgi:hypothetical protein